MGFDSLRQLDLLLRSERGDRSYFAEVGTKRAWPLGAIGPRGGGMTLNVNENTGAIAQGRSAPLARSARERRRCINTYFAGATFGSPAVCPPA